MEKSWGYSALLPNREWNQKQKHKKQPWSNVECFAFGGATVRFASLETSFHAANHTTPPPPSYEGYPFCPKDKNRSPFHGEKTPDDKMISWKKAESNLPKRFHMVGTRYFASAPNIRYGTKLWADVKYHVSTGFFRRRRAVFILLAMPPPSLGRAALVM